MDIFENKNHRGLIYNGHKPVRVLQDPREGSGDLYGFTGQGGWGNQYSDQWDRHVRHVPNAGSNPGNPGPPTFDERFPRGVFSGGRGPSIDAAFSGSDPSRTEFPLGRALRKKAKEMEK